MRDPEPEPDEVADSVDRLKSDELELKLSGPREDTVESELKPEELDGTGLVVDSLDEIVNPEKPLELEVCVELTEKPEDLEELKLESCDDWDLELKFELDASELVVENAELSELLYEADELVDDIGLVFEVGELPKLTLELNVVKSSSAVDVSKSVLDCSELGSSDELDEM